MFQLKKGKEAFTVVEGPMAGRSFKPGKTYTEIPPQEAGKFTEINKAAPAREVAKPAGAEIKKAVVTLPPSEKGRK